MGESIYEWLGVNTSDLSGLLTLCLALTVLRVQVGGSRHCGCCTRNRYEDWSCRDDERCAGDAECYSHRSKSSGRSYCRTGRSNACDHSSALCDVARDLCDFGMSKLRVLRNGAVDRNPIIRCAHESISQSIFTTAQIEVLTISANIAAFVAAPRSRCVFCHEVGVLLLIAFVAQIAPVESAALAAKASLRDG